MILDLIIPLLMFFAVLLLQGGAGLLILDTLRFAEDASGWERFYLSWFLGFPLHLLLVLLFSAVFSFSDWIPERAPLFWVLTLLPLLGIGAVVRRPLLGLLSELLQLRPTLPFAIYFSIIFAIGLSLFDAVEGITTPWTNNFGDLPFHLGMITSFVYGQNLPPEYFVFPPLRLSYPFFINLWSALLWWPRPTFGALDTIFTLQWCFLWGAVYLALKRLPTLAYALLLAGGSVESLARGLLGGDVSLSNVLAGRFKREDFPWEPILSTVWVTQRSALLGVSLVLIALGVFHRREKGRPSRDLLLVGLLLGLGVLSHAHIAFVGMLYCGAVLGIGFMVRGWHSPSQGLQKLLWFGSGTLVALLSLPFLIGKTHLIKGIVGWMPWSEGDALSERIVGSLAMWFSNGMFILPVLVLFLFLVPDLKRWGALSICFLFGNGVLLSIWEWDQLKFFLGLFAIMLSVMSTVPLEGRGSRWIYALPLTLLLVPGGAVFGRFLFEGENHTIFTKEEVRTAERINRETRPCAVLAAKPDHNSPVMLSGRKLIVGYDGWLWTHGIDYQGRHQEVLGTREQASKLLESERVGCEGYLLNSPRESWNRGGELLERIF